MDLCGTAVAAGAAWVYRSTVFDKELPDFIAQAIEQPGFAMLDIWELCTAYYSPRNKIKKKELYDLIESYGFQLGLLANKPRSEYSVHYRDAYEAGKSVIKRKPTIDKKYSNNVGKQTGIVIAGSAGQKIKSTATLFAEASIFSGLDATQKDLKRARPRIEKLPETCTLYAEESLELPETKAKIVRLPLNETAKKVGRLSIAVVALAAVLAETGLFPIEAFETAISTFQKAKIAEINVKAAEAGVELVST